MEQLRGKRSTEYRPNCRAVTRGTGRTTELQFDSTRIKLENYNPFKLQPFLALENTWGINTPKKMHQNEDTTQSPTTLAHHEHNST